MLRSAQKSDEWAVGITSSAYRKDIVRGEVQSLPSSALCLWLSNAPLFSESLHCLLVLREPWLAQVVANVSTATKEGVPEARASLQAGIALLLSWPTGGFVDN